MEKLLELLGAKFDEYQELHYKNQDKQKSDYYLYVGMTSGIREALEIVEQFITDQKGNYGSDKFIQSFANVMMSLSNRLNEIEDVEEGYIESDDYDIKENYHRKIYDFINVTTNGMDKEEAEFYKSPSNN